MDEEARPTVKQSKFEVLDKWDTKPLTPSVTAKKAIDGHGRSSKTERVEWTLSAVREHVAEGGRVLDVGAGRGLLVYALLKAGFRAEGIEPHQGAIEQGERVFGIKMRLGGVYDLNNEWWDAIAMTEVIEHLQWPERALTILERSTGVLVLTTPEAEDRRRKEGKHGPTLRSKYHLREWSSECLTDFIHGCSVFRCAEQFVTDGEIRAVYKHG